MNKTAAQKMIVKVAQALNKRGNDPSKYKTREDFIQNGQLGRSLGDVEGQIERAEEWDAWDRSRKVTQAAQQNGTHVPGSRVTGTYRRGQLTSVNGRPVKPATATPAPTSNRRQIQPRQATKTPVVTKTPADRRVETYDWTFR